MPKKLKEYQLPEQYMILGEKGLNRYHEKMSQIKFFEELMSKIFDENEILAVSIALHSQFGCSSLIGQTAPCK